MKLSIDYQELDVAWEDNDSVKALKGILPLTINMHEYGGLNKLALLVNQSLETIHK